MKHFFQLFTAALAVGGIGAFIATPSQAASIDFSLNPFTGDAAKVDITLTENDGKIDVFANVDTSTAMADLRGLFFDYTDEREDTLLPQLNITDFSAWGINPKSSTTTPGTVQIAKNSVSGGIGGANFQGGGSGNICASGCDGGIEIGQNGLKGGKDDYQSVTWSFTRSDGQALSLKDLQGMSWGARVMSVGANREGSSKLGGLTPIIEAITEEPEYSAQVPEPGMVSAFIILAGGAVMNRKRRLGQAVEA